jgi:BlaI family transcriptional regulator, penicillinase repressor
LLKWLKIPVTRERQLGPLESSLLNTLWKLQSGATVRELLAGSHVTAAYTTVMTTLDRLYKKGILDRAAEGRAFRYRARQTEQEFKANIVAAEVQRLLSSTSDPAIPLSFLVDTVSNYDSAFLDELQRAVQRKRRELRKTESQKSAHKKDGQR